MCVYLNMEVFVCIVFCCVVLLCCVSCCVVRAAPLPSIGSKYSMRKGNSGRNIYIYENFQAEKKGTKSLIARYPAQVADPNPDPSPEPSTDPSCFVHYMICGVLYAVPHDVLWYMMWCAACRYVVCCMICGVLYDALCAVWCAG